MGCICIPTTRQGHHYVGWIATVFRSCMYTEKDVVSFFAGLVNIGFWLVAQGPQIYENYKNGNAGALSFTFVFTWLLGDITNLLGCILTDQLPTQLYTAIYFCAMDGILLSQYAYYWWKNRKPEAERVRINGSPKLAAVFVLGISLTGITGLVMTANAAKGNYTLNAAVGAMAGGRSLLEWLSSSSRHQDVCNPPFNPSLPVRVLGDIFAWASGCLYFFGRIPQIYHNYKRKSVEGLSMFMFFCAASANICYAVQIALGDTGSPFKIGFYESTFPYILGSLFTMVWQVFVLGQAWWYRKRGTQYSPIPDAKP